MKANEFRAIALSMAEASESAHMGHPDFRVGGKIFASLGYPDDSFGAVMLASEEQEKLLRAHPGIFTPANGAWGRRGSTCVRLDAVRAPTLRKAIAAAWRTRAPKRLTEQHR
ncbi:MAG: MmcQ/YjbR family DNA-binding protein [Chthoniobacterales bacterium]|nr:MmcQ/YjbR family DNA-binding protein [Chthoniobacterales bacterium]